MAGSLGETTSTMISSHKSPEVRLRSYDKVRESGSSDSYQQSEAERGSLRWWSLQVKLKKTDSGDDSFCQLGSARLEARQGFCSLSWESRCAFSPPRVYQKAAAVHPSRHYSQTSTAMISLGPGARFAVVVMLGSTTAIAFQPFPFWDDLQEQDNRGRNFPCPDDTDIYPCTCDFVSLKLELNCSHLTTDDLRRVFSATFPFFKFDRFILQDSNIPVLQSDVFGEAIFESVVFEFNNMSIVESGALSKSYGVLENFTMHEEASSLPFGWPLPDINSFTSLKKIDVSGPYATLDPLMSNSLTEVILSLYNLTKLPSNPFSGATSIKTLILRDTNLRNIEANTFVSLRELEMLEISGASLTNLVQSSMAFGSTNLGLVQLSMNGIADVNDGAFSGLPESAILDLSNNQLTELRSGAFASVLTSLTDGYIDIGNNPLLCGCDLGWLVYLEDVELHHLHGLNSSCDIEGNYKPSDILDFLEYQCSTESAF